jgi:xanthine dehydrogenase YagR molybdenum-binding subunit
VNINAGAARAFRAPGHPTASFGMESIMDTLAEKMNLDPVELRIKNDPRKSGERNIASAPNDSVGRRNTKSRAAHQAGQNRRWLRRRDLGRGGKEPKLRPA